MKRVLITTICEDAVNMFHTIGDVTDVEYQQLRLLAESTVYDRQAKVPECPVLLRIFNYTRDGGTYYEDSLRPTEHFRSVRPEEVPDQLCYHIIWHASG